MKIVRIMILVLTCPIWIPAGLFMIAFAIPLALIGGLMGLIAYGFGWEDY